MADTVQRYILFAGDTYYAEGGALDFHSSGTEDQLTELIAKGIERTMKDEDDLRWFHVYDVKINKVVAASIGLNGGSFDYAKRMIAEDCIMFKFRDIDEQSPRGAIGTLKKILVQLTDEEQKEQYRFLRDK